MDKKDTESHAVTKNVHERKLNGTRVDKNGVAKSPERSEKMSLNHE